MTGRVLVLGAAGRIGHAAAAAFRSTGWTVRSLMRPGAAARAPSGTQVIEADALDRAAVIEAARDTDVVLHALNPTYTQWERLALPLTYAAIAAAEENRATLMFLGNVYNYGSGMPPVLDENTPMRPTSRKGRLRVAIEERMREAAERGVQVLILRAGDFYGGGRGSWFDLVIARDLARGRLTFPGPLGVVHEWAYVPDLAAAVADLAAARQRLGLFESFGFPGHAVTGEDFAAAIRRALRRELQVKPMSWWLIHLLRPVIPLSRELSEIAYLWNVPHRIDGSRLRSAIRRIPHTAFDEAVKQALRELGIAAA